MVISKMNKRNNKILIDAVPIGKDLLKIGVREPKVAKIDDTIISEQIISCVFSDDRVSLISTDATIFLLNF